MYTVQQAVGEMTALGHAISPTRVRDFANGHGPIGDKPTNLEEISSELTAMGYVVPGAYDSLWKQGDSIPNGWEQGA